MVVSTAGGLTLSRKLARGAATDRQLEDAYHDRPAGGRQGRAAGEGRIRGAHRPRQRGVLPVLADRHHRAADPAAHEGQVYAFRIIEYKEGGRNLVVSRRALLEEQQRASAAEVRQSIVPGAVITGRVASVREFGAFVDLGGGVQGLLHVSEMGWSRVSDASQVVKPGDEITVKVLRVDDDKQKISLGLKQLTADPWSTVPTTYEVGQVRTGRVTRVAEFGAFVELEPGIEALAHASTFAPTGRSEGWSAQVAVGMTGGVRDPEHRSREEADRRRARCRKARRARAARCAVAGRDRAGRAPHGQGRASREVRRVRVPRAGAHRADPDERDRRCQGRRTSPSAFPVGADVEVDRPRGRPVGPPHSSQLARRSSTRTRPRKCASTSEREDVAPADGFGSLADKLRGALKPRS